MHYVSSGVESGRGVVNKPAVFSNRPEDFLLWVRSFNIYCKQLRTVEEKILVLFELTKGDAKDAIEALMFEPMTKETLD